MRRPQKLCTACLCLLALHVLAAAAPLQAGVTGKSPATEAQPRIEKFGGVESAEKALVVGQGRQLQPTQLTERQALPLLVSLLDGSIAAVDEVSGRRLWQFNTGAPLVSNKGASAGRDGALSTIFPGADGSLYAYRHDEQSYEILGETIEDLVAAAPGAAAFDGSLVLGAKDTTLYVLDSRSGELVEEISAVGGRLLQVASLLDRVSGPPDGAQSPGAAALAAGHGLLVARSNWHVHSLGRGGGVRWNVTYGRLQQLSMPALHALADGSKLPPSSQESPGLWIGPQNSLLCYDQRTGLERWATSFESPLVGAFPDGGDINTLPGPLDEIMPNEDLGRIWVGQLPASGSLYALPASYYNFDFEDKPCTRPGGGDEGEVDGEEAHDSGAVPCAERSLPPAAWEPEGSGRRVASNASTVPLGMHEVSALTQVGLALPAGRSSRYDLLQLQAREPQRLLPMTDAERQAWAAPGMYNGPLQGWSWKLLAGLALAAAFTVVLAGLAGAAGFVVLARRRDAASAPPPTAVPAAQHESTSTQVGRETAEQFASAAAALNGSAPRGKKGRRRKPRFGQALTNGVSAVNSTATSSTADSDLSEKEAEADSRGSHSASIRSSGRRPHSMADDRDSASNSGPNSVPDGGDGGRSSVRSKASSSSQPDDGQGDTQAEPVQDSPRTPLPPGVTRIGRVQVGTKVLGYGSGGTVVLEGELEGRPVAIKRLLARFADLARTEINALIHTDDHPNVVRCFSMERDAQFVYLALERCSAALHDIVEAAPAAGLRFTEPAAEGGKPLPAAGADGSGPSRPTALAWAVARDIGEGLAFLHSRGFVHRDLKPHNVLLAENGRAKVSDMGLCTRLHNDASSFETPGAGGSQGWQAYEQLVSRSGGAARQSRAVDVFSYGLLLHYCLSGGRHPFGARYERDMNILQGRFSLEALKGAGQEARNLVAAMLARDSSARPPMAAVLAHPAWWAPARKLAFLVDLSNAMEFQDRTVDQSLLTAFEACGAAAFGGAGWGAALSSSLMHDLSRYRDYRYTSLRDLLRVVRNKRTHFYEMPPETQAQMGPLPDGFLRYFVTRFPRLFLTGYTFALGHLASEASMAEYFPADAQALMAPFFAADSGGKGPPGAAPSSTEVPPEAGPSAAKAAAAAALRPRGEDATAAAAASNPAIANGAAAASGSDGERLSEASSQTQQPMRLLNPTATAFAASVPTPAADSAAHQQKGSGGSGPLTAGHGRTSSDASASSPPPQRSTWGGAPASSGHGHGTAPPTPRLPPASPASRPAWGTTSSHAPPAPASATSPAAAAPSPAPPTKRPDSAFAGAASLPRQSAAAAAPPPRQDAQPAPSGDGDSGGGGVLGPPRQSGSEVSDLDDDYLASLIPNDLEIGSPMARRHPRSGSGAAAGDSAGGTGSRQRGPAEGSQQSAGRQQNGASGGRSPAQQPPQQHQWQSPAHDGRGPYLQTSPAARPQGLPHPPVPMPHHMQQLLQQPAGGCQFLPQQHPYGQLPPGLQQQQQHPKQVQQPASRDSEEGLLQRFPSRPGHPVCDFYQKTGHCKYGEACKFDHPEEYGVQLNASGLPIRPGEPVCSFYAKKGDCKFGPSCKFNHPPPRR